MSRRRRILVAGHICLDIIASIPASAPEPGALAPRSGTPPVAVRALALEPGALDLVGPATLAIGGCVGNTGVALHRLGMATSLVARIGDDAMGSLLRDLVTAAVPGPDVRLIETAGATSYSLVHNRRGVDRAIQHFPGVNDAFVAADVPDDLLASASIVHVGYPPLMAALVAEDGAELRALLERARAQGAATSLDLADVRVSAGRSAVDWPRLLGRVLPHVDLFLPSLEEACHLLAADGSVAFDAAGRPDLDDVSALAARMLELGVAVAGVKLGEHGLYVRMAGSDRLRLVPGLDAAAWAGRELHSTVFTTDVAGTTGAGDATIAGFLFALASGMPPDAAVTAACAVGGASTEREDGTSGIPSWSVIERRLADGWARREAWATREAWPARRSGIRGS